MGIWNKLNEQKQKLSKTINQKREEHQEKQEEKDKVFGKKLKTFFLVKYKGGHPNITKEVTGNLYLYEKKIEFNANILGSFSIDLDKVEPRVESQKDIDRRVTASRLLLIGVFAFAARKTEVHETNYLTLQYKENNRDYLVRLEAKKAQGICNEIVSAREKLPLKPDEKTTDNRKVTNESNNLDNLEQLAELKEKGIITQKEFEAKKKKILES